MVLINEGELAVVHVPGAVFKHTNLANKDPEHRTLQHSSTQQLYVHVCLIISNTRLVQYFISSDISINPRLNTRKYKRRNIQI